MNEENINYKYPSFTGTGFLILLTFKAYSLKEGKELTLSTLFHHAVPLLSRYTCGDVFVR